MSQTFSIWILIALSLVTANLPFVIETPFLVLPWSQNGESRRPVALQFLFGLLFLSAVATLAWGVYTYLGQVNGFNLDGNLVLFGKLVLASAFATIVMGFPAWKAHGRVVHKSLFTRLLELFVFYILMGALGFAFESNIGNRFQQGWEFYAITLCLFLVMAYPGFVYRYLMQRGKARVA